MSLKGKIILITGASRGIGKAIALHCADAGARVLLHYHEAEEDAETVAASIQEKGGEVAVFQADFGHTDQVLSLAAKAWQQWGQIDVLINNAGISYKKHFLDQQPEDIDAFFQVNFQSAFFLTQAILRNMVEQKIEGAVYTITSINGIQPGVGHSVYGASKGALETLMKGIALEMAPHGIRVNTVAVGAIKTDINAAVWQDPEKLSLVNEHIPLNRMGEPEEVAAVVCSLIATGTYLTGATIAIDGGWLLRHGYQRPEPYKK